MNATSPTPDTTLSTNTYTFYIYIPPEAGSLNTSTECYSAEGDFEVGPPVNIASGCFELQPGDQISFVEKGSDPYSLQPGDPINTVSLQLTFPSGVTAFQVFNEMADPQLPYTVWSNGQGETLTIREIPNIQEPVLWCMKFTVTDMNGNTFTLPDPEMQTGTGSK